MSGEILSEAEVARYRREYAGLTEESSAHVPAIRVCDSHEALRAELAEATALFQTCIDNCDCVEAAGGDECGNCMRARAFLAATNRETPTKEKHK